MYAPRPALPFFPPHSPACRRWDAEGMHTHAHPTHALTPGLPLRAATVKRGRLQHDLSPLPRHHSSSQGQQLFTAPQKSVLPLTWSRHGERATTWLCFAGQERRRRRKALGAWEASWQWEGRTDCSLIKPEPGITCPATSTGISTKFNPAVSATENVSPHRWRGGRPRRGGTGKDRVCLAAEPERELLGRQRQAARTGRQPTTGLFFFWAIAMGLM